MIITIKNEDEQLFNNILESYRSKFDKYKDKGKNYDESIIILSNPIITKDDTIKKEKYIRFSNIILKWIMGLRK